MIDGIRAWRPCRGLGFVLLAVALLAPAAAAQTPADAVFYRIFLRDGTTVVSYGDFARVAGRVVFSIPISIATNPPTLELVSLAESSVDWTRTDEYAEAARARHYADTRGEQEFAALSNEVARALNDVALTEDPQRRLALADRARRVLADWPSRNYGYRANDVAQLSALLDEVVSELRVAAGLSRFDVSLVANTTPPPSVPLMAPPTLRESIAGAFTAARLTPDAGERVSLLKAIESALASAATDETWAAALRARASADLAIETKTDRDYADLASRVLATARQRLERADVKGIESLVRQVLKADDRLGRKRPQTTAALLATLDARIDSARRLRLARDAWALRIDGVRKYQKKIRSPMGALLDARPWLEQIRQLAGPEPATLPDYEQRTASASRELALVKPPAGLDAVHGMLTSAFQMAVRAAQARAKAAHANDMTVAWEASSAAAGALLLMDHARDEMQRMTAPPVK